VQHVVVTRFSVPRQDAASATRHADRAWLAERLSHFRRYYVPSVGRLGVPAVLLCSSASAPYIGDRLSDLPWATVVVQDSWYGGWSGSPEQMLTRLDSDDALHHAWFERLEIASSGTSSVAAVEVYCTKSVLRLDSRRGKLYSLTRQEPSPLAAFAAGANPFLHDHKHLEAHYRVHGLAAPYLLPVVHGGNLSSRAPAWWRLRRQLPLARLADFGVA
jgi:hypothetical protein